MKKAELMALAEKHGMEFLVNNEVEQMKVGVWIRTDEDIPELETELKNGVPGPVVVLKEYDPVGDFHTYRVTAPSNWFDKWGWS